MARFVRIGIAGLVLVAAASGGTAPSAVAWFDDGSALRPQALQTKAPPAADILLAQVGANGGRASGSTAPTHGEGVAGPVGTNDVVNAVNMASDRTQQSVVGCGVKDFTESSHCIADALDAYAAELDGLAPSLPPKLRTLPGIVHDAAARVRAAKTKAEAIRALKAAQAQVSHTLAMLRADDPNSVQVGQQVGRSVNETLGVAQEGLQRSSEL